MSPTVHPSDTSAHPVLILDDEPAVLHSLRETLERAGYHVVASQSPLDALERVRDGSFSVIITDMRMPEMNGLEFLEYCKELQPDATRMLITAVLSLSSVLEVINSGAIYRFIPKPWLHEELLAAVENSVQRFVLTTQSRQLVEENEALKAEQVTLRQALAASTSALETLEKTLAGIQEDTDRRHHRTLELCWRILNTYDPALGRRTRAIVNIAQIFATHGGFIFEEQRILGTAAWLCDLGLLGVGKEALITAREGDHALSETDRSLLRNHPVYSQTLAALLDEDRLLGTTIRAHHEHFDGSGYPDGLVGDAIPWTSRCLAVVVGWVEAGLSHNASQEWLLRESGRRFDPEAVRRFINATRGRLEPSRQRAVREVLTDDLRPGMVLSQGVYSPSGLLLVAEGQPLSPTLIEKIHFHHKVASPGQRLTVYT